MSEDRRAVLEGVAYGSDPKVTPADRLRALDMLAQLPGGGAAHDPYGLAHLSSEELDRELAGFFAGPTDAQVEVMVRHRAARLLEESQEWQAQERRVSERARKLAAHAAPSAEDDVTGAADQVDGQARPDAAEESQLPKRFTQDDLPPGVTFADLNRGYRQVGE